MNKSKKIIFISDDMALTHNSNEAIFELLQLGKLTGTSLLANGECYEDAVDKLKNLSGFSLGVHLNIVEGLSLTQCKYLTDIDGKFKLNYLKLILLSFNKNFRDEVEKEFRAQIEKVLNSFNGTNIIIDRLDSHVHTHAIPFIFNIVQKLAIEYKIHYVRLQNERIYKSNGKYPKLINLIKIFLLKFFTFFNKRSILSSNLSFNNYIVGVGFTGEMNKNTILDGLENVSIGTVEILIHAEKNSLNKAREIEFESAKELDIL